MSYIPSRHNPEKDGYDYNALSEYQKGLLDGIDLVILDDAFWADGKISLLHQAINDASGYLSDLESFMFDKMKDNIVQYVEKYIDSDADDLYTAMCESDEKENAPVRPYAELT